MDKGVLKSFAINSRNKLIDDTIFKLNLIGISKNEIKDPIAKSEGMEVFQIASTNNYTIYDEDIDKRKSLIKQIRDKGFDNIVEEVAYTWFNRIIAIRFMEVNNFLPTRTRVLSSETTNKNEPDIIREALNIDLNYTDDDKKLIIKLKEENKLDELFRFLFIKQCNKLNEILPGLFEKTDDYTELLLNINFTDENGVIRQLIDNIPEEYFKNQVEIIGWLYQFYISEKKDKIINIKRGNIKKEDIPAATQLFTPDWIVRYMVDNSLGKFWIERNNNSNLKNSLKFYIEEAPQEDSVNNFLETIRNNKYNIENIKFFDPCMGSAHILVYAFDVFYKIYEELGYLKKEIPELIIKNNLFGLDIDKRAYQLAYFAILMKARIYDRRILDKNIKPNVYVIKESENITEDLLKYIKQKDKFLFENINYLKNLFVNAKEYGSLIQINKDIDLIKIKNSLNNLVNNMPSTLKTENYKNIIKNYIEPLISQTKLLNQKYEVVVTNPPYMNKFDKTFKEFNKKHYKDYSRDLFSIFIYRNFDFCKKNGYSAFMTPYVWMFISSYEKLREYIINNKNISSLIQLEYSAFKEATVPLCTFVLSNNYDKNYRGTYLKITEFTGGMEIQKQKVLEIIKNPVVFNDKNKFITQTKKFNKIPGKPIAYWVSDNLIECFNNTKLDEISNVKVGLQTGDNKRFLRYWYEVDYNKISFSTKTCKESENNGYKWFPYNKGGNYCKWYGNQEYIVNWENNGFEIRNLKNSKGKIKSRPQNTQFYFKESLSWSKISSGKIAFRYYPDGFIFDVAGCSIFPNNNIFYILGFLNSNISNKILDFISPTLNYEVGHVSSLPLIINNKFHEIIVNLVNDNVDLCKWDWDDYEVSWNFKKHPLLKFNKNLISKSYEEYKNLKKEEFNKLKQNEIKLNKIFSEIYNINTDCSVDDKYISIHLANYEKDIKSFISYAVGCMFGRYSLNKEGLIYTNEKLDLNNYNEFIPDEDNIIPILDTEYFDDDIVGRFVEFVKICFGEKHLEENLDFIAKGLNKKEKTSREIIREYFLKDFFKDHTKTYNKHPIYWQFDSGKQNGFKCLIYIHRYNPNLLSKIRTDYLHKTQKAIEESMTNYTNIKENSELKSEVKEATKSLNKLNKQLDETKKYDEILAHLANQKIEIDLDDGVKANYAKFQNIQISNNNKKQNLLKKI